MPPRVFILDNTDSFTFNLAQAFLKLGAEVRVERAVDNSAKSVRRFLEEGGAAWRPTHLVLSPGPLRPEDHPMNFHLLDRFAGRVPILGVCLGMQAINEWCGGTITGARVAPSAGKVIDAFPVCLVPPEPVCPGMPPSPPLCGCGTPRDIPPMHGKTSAVRYIDDAPLFDGLPNPFIAARYHSLVVDQVGEGLLPVAWVASDQRLATSDGVIMSLTHASMPIVGVQFHPESYLTPDGEKLLANFLGDVSQRVTYWYD